MNQEPGCWSDPGRRRTNQDAAIHTLLGGGLEVAAVADGMGGHLGGEVASREALESLVSALEGGSDLRSAVRAANDRVYQRSLQSSELSGMGSTLVVYLRRGNEFTIANVGDSRAYLIDGESITLLTRDHSFVAEAIASGELTEEEASRSRWRNALTRAIGTDPEVEADLFGPFAVDRPQTILLCTDGFYRWLAEDEVPSLVAAAPDLRGAAAVLGEGALAGGSDDNITVLLVGARPIETPGAEIESVSEGVESALANPSEPLSEVALPVVGPAEARARGQEQGQGRVLQRQARRPRQRRQGQMTGELGRWWHRLEPIIFVLALLCVVAGLAVLMLWAS